MKHQVKSIRRLLAFAAVCLSTGAFAGGNHAGGHDHDHGDDAIGKPGYFQQTYAVYGRDGWPCPVCGGPVASVRIGQRSSFYCPHCQC